MSGDHNMNQDYDKRIDKAAKNLGAGTLKINKTFEALLRGYILFDVNGKLFLLYNSALAERKATLGDVYFKGWHIFKGWRGFYERFNNGR